MKLVGLLILLIIAIGLSGCNTLSGRIRRNQEEFNRYPADVQAAIRAGRIRIGFTRKQVEIALGLPDRVYKRTTAKRTTQVWAYLDRNPRFTIGVGVGIGSHQFCDGFCRGFSTILVDDPDDGRYERLRIEFDGNKVIAIEESQRR